jgi:hypothetical protein
MPNNRQIGHLGEFPLDATHPVFVEFTPPPTHRHDPAVANCGT